MRTFIVFIVLLVCIVLPAYGSEVPKLTGRVNDYTNTLSADQIAALDKKLAAHEKASTDQITVLLIPTLNGEDIEGYSIRVAEAWKIGTKEKDNGVIVVIAKNDKLWRIETGKGLEGSLTDLIAGRIGKQYMIPLFKEGKFYEGIDTCVDKIIAVIHGENVALDTDTKVSDDKKNKHVPFIIAFFVTLFTGFALWFVHPTVGGLGSGAVAAISSYLLAGSLTAILITAAIGFFIGLFAPIILQIALQCGFGALGGGDGDSFGGGGGDFGGGGAGGDW